jgi:mRNA interferase RelE/StbE
VVCTAFIKPSAQRDLDAFPDKQATKILSRIGNLENNPRPVGVQKLNDQEGYRIRSGNYRILFEVDDSKKIVFVYRIKHRKEVYR